jgi:hypothetical protein
MQRSNIDSYVPNYPLTIFAAAIFSLSLILHLGQIYAYRTWYFITIPIGLILEIMGYICRSMSAHVNPYNVLYFVLQYFFIVTAPVFLSAGIYAILSILISRTSATYSVLSPKTILWVFITSDVVTTAAQISGAALVGSAQSKQRDPTTGKNILLGGLAIQVAITFVFLVLLFLFLQKSRGVLMAKNGKKAFVISFVVATLLVYLRTCFRLAEVAQGLSSYLFTHEAFFAGLEFAPIACAMLLFNIWHPGRCLRNTQEDAGEHPTEAEGLQIDTDVKA